MGKQQCKLEHKGTNFSFPSVKGHCVVVTICNAKGLEVTE